MFQIDLCGLLKSGATKTILCTNGFLSSCEICIFNAHLRMLERMWISLHFFGILCLFKFICMCVRKKERQRSVFLRSGDGIAGFLLKCCIHLYVAPFTATTSLKGGGWDIDAAAFSVQSCACLLRCSPTDLNGTYSQIRDFQI